MNIGIDAPHLTEAQILARQMINSIHLNDVQDPEVVYLFYRAIYRDSPEYASLPPSLQNRLTPIYEAMDKPKEFFNDTEDQDAFYEELFFWSDESANKISKFIADYTETTLQYLDTIPIHNHAEAEEVAKILAQLITHPSSDISKINKIFQKKIQDLKELLEDPTMYAPDPVDEYRYRYLLNKLINKRITDLSTPEGRLPLIEYTMEREKGPIQPAANVALPVCPWDLKNLTTWYETMKGTIFYKESENKALRLEMLFLFLTNEAICNTDHPPVLRESVFDMLSKICGSATSYGIHNDVMEYSFDFFYVLSKIFIRDNTLSVINQIENIDSAVKTLSLWRVIEERLKAAEMSPHLAKTLTHYTTALSRNLGLIDFLETRPSYPNAVLPLNAMEADINRHFKIHPLRFMYLESVFQERYPNFLQSKQRGQDTRVLVLDYLRMIQLGSLS